MEWLSLNPLDGIFTTLFTSTLRHAAFVFTKVSMASEAVVINLVHELHESSPLLVGIVLNIDAGPSLIQELGCLSQLPQSGLSRISGRSWYETTRAP